MQFPWQWSGGVISANLEVIWAMSDITITFSVDDPKDSTYWMPVIAGEPYYFVVRYYKPDVNNLPQKPCG